MVCACVMRAAGCNTLQRTVTHCNTLQKANVLDVVIDAWDIP